MGIRKHRVWQELPIVTPNANTKMIVTDNDGKYLGYTSVSALQTTVDGNGLATDADIAALQNQIGVSGSYASQDKYYATNNGNGTNFKVGDDAWIGDVNIVNTIQVSGIETPYEGYIKFGSGSNTPRIGTTGNSDLIIENAWIQADGIELNSNILANGDVSASKIYATELFRLDPQDSLPYGEVGVIAVSSSHLYFHNGTQWNQIG